MSGGQQRDAGHGHDPGLPGAGHRRPLAIMLAISGTILIVEAIGAVISGSLALLADAGHLPRLLDQLQQCLAGHFDVEHSTVQFEPASHAAHEHPVHA